MVSAVLKGVKYCTQMRNSIMFPIVLKGVVNVNLLNGGK